MLVDRPMLFNIYMGRINSRPGAEATAKIPSHSGPFSPLQPLTGITHPGKITDWAYS
jgi:hypothetical protein